MERTHSFPTASFGGIAAWPTVVRVLGREALALLVFGLTHPRGASR
jgi:hypothetical protein